VAPVKPKIRVKIPRKIPIAKNTQNHIGSNELITKYTIASINNIKLAAIPEATIYVNAI
jgi:hypothetical protein